MLVYFVICFTISYYRVACVKPPPPYPPKENPDFPLEGKWWLYIAFNRPVVNGFTEVIMSCTDGSQHNQTQKTSAIEK